MEECPATLLRRGEHSLDALTLAVDGWEEDRLGLARRAGGIRAASGTCLSSHTPTWNCYWDPLVSRDAPGEFDYFRLHLCRQLQDCKFRSGGPAPICTGLVGSYTN